MADPFNPRGQSFAERIRAFRTDANDTYRVHVRTDRGRTPEWEQKHHVAHMFLYNAYGARIQPRVREPGKFTIAWSHLSDPTVQWQGVRWEHLLRTADGGVPRKVGSDWDPGARPDRDATVKNLKTMQIYDGIGRLGFGMVAAGFRPCGEPCRCRAGRSKHLDGLAADINRSDLAALTNALRHNRGPTLDDYLKRFGLYRPLLHHPKSPEDWHVEALPDNQL
jgi:hypothetical protein